MFTFHEVNGKIVAELTDNGFIINKVQDAIYLLCELGSQGCCSMILHENNLSKDFFDLKTRLAGEILQKFSNYHFKLAIIGDFSKYTSKSLNDFIRESNRGSLICFADDLQSALKHI